MSKGDNKRNSKRKKNSWMRVRHRVVTAILRGPLALYCRLKYHMRVERFREQQKRPYLILYNHQTTFDPFYIATAFKGPVYYLASEDLFSNGWVSSLIRFLVAPIPIRKQTTDTKAVMTIMRVVREGGTVCIAPEGNRTYSGRTLYMNPSIAPLVKKLGVPLVLFHLRGGYGAQPRWSDVVRNGPMRAYVHEVIEPETLAEMSNDEIMARIRDGLMIDEGVVDHPYYSKKSAEYLERVVFMCPDCGFVPWTSKGELVTCTKCGRQVRYLPSKELEGVGKPFPFRFVRDWYDYQVDSVNRLDPMQHTEQPLFRDTARLSEVILYKNKIPIAARADIALYGDRIEIVANGETVVYPFAELGAITVLGRNKLNLYHGDRLYQLKNTKGFNALKYVFLYHRYRNVASGHPEETFLGM